MKKNGTVPRQASIQRATKETDIRVEWTLDGSGQGKITTSIRFFDHMLELLAKHGFFDLTVQAKGDIDIDGRKYGLVLDIGGWYKNVITLAPSLHISKSEIDLAIRLLDALITRVTRN